MLGISKINKTLSILTGVALICAASISASASGVIAADINVRGAVTVNDQPAVSSSTVVSGSTITTGSDSGAVIGIGGNGRVELKPDTTLTLDYGVNTISAVLTSGGIRVTNAVGIATTVSTPDAVVAADAARANTFSIDAAGSGSLTHGKLTVVSTKDPVRITTLNGRVASLVSGESVVQDDDDDDDDNRTALAVILFGGAAAAILIPLLLKDDRPDMFSTAGNQVSPFQ